MFMICNFSLFLYHFLVKAAHGFDDHPQSALGTSYQADPSSSGLQSQNSSLHSDYLEEPPSRGPSYSLSNYHTNAGTDSENDSDDDFSAQTVGPSDSYKRYFSEAESYRRNNRNKEEAEKIKQKEAEPVPESEEDTEVNPMSALRIKRQKPKSALKDSLSDNGQSMSAVRMKDKNQKMFRPGRYHNTIFKKSEAESKKSSEKLPQIQEEQDTMTDTKDIFVEDSDNESPYIDEDDEEEEEESDEDDPTELDEEINHLQERQTRIRQHQKEVRRRISKNRNDSSAKADLKELEGESARINKSLKELNKRANSGRQKGTVFTQKGKKEQHSDNNFEVDDNGAPSAGESSQKCSSA